MDSQPAQPSVPTATSTSSPGSTPGGYISAPHLLVGPAWEGLKPNLWTYIAAILLLVLPIVVGAILSVVVPAVGILVTIVVAVLEVLLVAPALYRIMLASAKQQRISLAQSLDGGASLGARLLWSEVLMVLAVIGGLILLIIPGIWIVGRLALVQYVVVEEGLSGPAAIKRSWGLTRGRWWEIVGTAGMLSAVNIFSVIPVIGPIISFVIDIVLAPVMAARYLGLVALKSHPDQPQPPVHASNYWWLLGFVTIVLGNHGYHTPTNTKDTWSY